MYIYIYVCMYIYTISMYNPLRVGLSLNFPMEGPRLKRPHGSTQSRALFLQLSDGRHLILPRRWVKPPCFAAKR